MRTEKVISKELLSHLVLLESDHQAKVLSDIKQLLNTGDASQEARDINNRAKSSEQDIAAGRIKKAETFKREFAQWQKKKRASLKL